ncbi:tight adherence protein B [Mumia flava]|uniref:Tight adherence protein B n=1 Tax=Mumia flava TaxID=1348852 RepID=A0A2M9BHF4_9ACTN|nr:type II secretion system F family protein [Mumia flava]PJJ57369.1 tight adherence protein B [Mumia flava]
MTAAVAALAAGASMWLWVPGGRWRLRRVVGPDPGGASGWRSVPVLARGDSSTAVIVLACVVVTCLVVAGVRPMVATAAAVAVVTALRIRARTRRRRTVARTRREVARACDALASELAAGTAAQRALDTVAAEWEVLRPAAASARLGADPTEAIRVAARRSGADGLRVLAAASEVSRRTGAPQAMVLDRALAALRADEDLAREVEAALGPPRATAKLLAVLPGVALALGAGLGGDPLAFLLDSRLGGWCLLLGVCAAAAGLVWVERIADGASR